MLSDNYYIPDYDTLPPVTGPTPTMQNNWLDPGMPNPQAHDEVKLA